MGTVPRGIERYELRLWQMAHQVSAYFRRPSYVVTALYHKSRGMQLRQVGTVVGEERHLRKVPGDG